MTLNIKYDPVSIRRRDSCATFLWITSCCLLSHLQESSFCDDENKHGVFHPQHHVAIPRYLTTAAGSNEPSDFKFHPIKIGVPYRLWNTVSNGLIQRDPHNPMVITCRGGFDDNNSEKHDLRNK